MEKHTPVLEAQNVSKSFYEPKQVRLFDKISLCVYPGETVSIMGASGEGKTTLMHVLGTLEPPSEGRLAILGEPVSAYNRCLVRRRHLGFIFQSFHLLEDYSLLENVLMPARIARKSVKKGSDSYERAFQLIEQVGLGKRIHFNTKLLSGGEKQRVAIARALLNDPDILLADEPSGNLDHANSARIHELLLSVASEQNKAVLIVTHDETLNRLCKRQYRLERGALYQSLQINS